MILAAQDVAASVREMCAAPGDDRAAERAELAIKRLEQYGEQASCADFGERIIEQERRWAVEDDRAAAGTGSGRHLRAL